jgi:predicted metal-dependent HD superfamily phosphohydrolase
VTGLRDRFVSAARRLGATDDPAPLADALLAAWSEPSRRYHDVAHLEDCLAQLDDSAAEATERSLIEAAIWFHDAVYEPLASDNEERSAAWARRALGGLGVPAATVGEVARLVLLTRHAESPPDTDRRGALLCDIDLSILGRGREAFERYDRNIRAEYAAVPEAAYRAARRRVLAALLARSPLYLTDRFRVRYEAAARDNLSRLLARLDSVDG